MKILLIGGKGTIGRSVAARMSEKHDLIIAGRNTGDVNVNIDDGSSIKAMFETIGKVDAVVCIAGQAKWASFDSLSEEDFYLGIRSKLMGQVNLVRIGRKYLPQRGSITLTTGILGDDPVGGTAAAALVNGGIHGFVKAASLELQHQIRLNVVSVGVVQDSYEKYKDLFPGYNPIPMEVVANCYVRAVEGWDNGSVIRAY